MPRGSTHRHRLSVVVASFALRRLSVDVGLLPPRAGSRTLALLFHAFQSLAFALRGRALAFVRALLPLVRQPLALVSDSIALIGDPVSSTGLKFASPELGLAMVQRFLAFVERVILAFQLLRWRLDMVLKSHDSP